MAENKFDSLTIKCLEEIPFMVEVLKSTSDRVCEEFSPYCDKIKNVLKEKIKGKKSWKVRDNAAWHFEPCILNDNIVNKKIIDLSKRFNICWRIDVEKKHGTQLKSSFLILLGFWYDDDYKPKSRFFFDIQNLNYKKLGILNELSFYKEIEKKNSSFKFEIDHPNQKADVELFEIYWEEVDSNKIEEAFNIFLNDVVIPFVGNLK